MSDPVSALQGARFDGFAQIREIGPVGMITLRAKGLKSLDKAVKAAVGTKVPAQRRIEVNADRACAWMSPDEYLLILPHAEVAAGLAAIAAALSGQH
ncbi:MAG: sarcosine oxidase subunit gamma, partial [Rhodobacterales bacterium]